MEKNALEFTEWLPLIRGEFTESPGLCLTRSQVQGWWSLDRASCDAVIAFIAPIVFLSMQGICTSPAIGSQVIPK